MPGKTFIVVAVVLFLSLAGFSLNSKGQTSNVAPANAFFTDDPNNNIRSDGAGVYFNRVDGVQCLIDYLSDDFILQLNFNGKKTAPHRRMFFDFTKPVIGSGSGAIDRGTFYDIGFLNVDSIGALAVGQSRLSQAQFNTPIGLLRFNPANYPGTSYVSVTRTSDTTWVLSAPAGGAVAALVQQAKNNTFKFVGNYHMPFQITVQLQ